MDRAFLVFTFFAYGFLWLISGILLTQSMLITVFTGLPAVGLASFVTVFVLSFLMRGVSSRYRNVKAYHEAVEAFQAWWLHTQETFWRSLSGRQFEAELAALYRRLGYRVELTPTSGDEGVDIWLHTERGKEIVQCKAHRNPIGPSVVRELHGTMEHFKVSRATLASTSGFTNGVVKYAQGKPIKLLGLTEIIALSAKQKV